MDYSLYIYIYSDESVHQLYLTEILGEMEPN